MGGYLCFGLATKIVIKQNLEKEKESNDERLKRIGRNIDLNLYDRKDYEDYTVLEIKKDIFEKNAITFIIDQCINLENIKNLNSYRELLVMIDSDYEKIIFYTQNNYMTLLKFLDGNKYINDISYLDTLGRSDIYCDLFCYLCEGKMFFENYYTFFNYIRRCIIESSENVIKTALVATLSDDKI